MKLLSKLFASNDTQVKSLQPFVDKIHSFAPSHKELTNEQIIEKTRYWQNELRNIPYDKQAKYLEQILPEAFALVKEAAGRSLKMWHFDVQLMAGVVLHQGKISEQKTGEGKTITATLPLYLNALTGRGVHLVTPNDYLARHGAGWMGKLYSHLGLTTGVIMQNKAFVYDPAYESAEFKDEYAKHLKEASRKEAYRCDITYGTNSEFGFDYLRDNLAQSEEQVSQVNPNGDYGTHYFAIVDEVDSILIDVARTPLIISSASNDATERYHDASKIVSSLIKDTDYEVDEKFHSATLTDLGVRRVERMLGNNNLYEEDFEMVHLIEQSLVARALYLKDRDYIVKDGRILIIDQFTGRILENNRFSHGLHQSIEAKENVPIQQESKTVASISYQNYFRMYEKLAGMTGTAQTEAEEFHKIYNLDVVVMPTNKPIARKDFNDVVYKTEAAKFRAVADEIVEKHEKGQPVLVGTTSVDKSELLHNLLKRRGVDHEILNAKNHEREALIIAQAGKKGSVTISTNMAGRGVDIILGGDPADPKDQAHIKELGGLHVIGTERHESRRIDNQLRGRSGRQGDTGSSRFYVSLQDDLMRVFGGNQVERLMDRFGLEENIPLEAGLVSRAIENAQKKVEGFNFDRRKQVVDMDNVTNVHRDVIYKLRRKIMLGYKTPEEFNSWYLSKLDGRGNFSTTSNWQNHIDKVGQENWLRFAAQISLPVIDLLWQEHLSDMDHLRESIGLRGYAQRDPIVEYKRESHERFSLLVDKMYNLIAERLSNLTVSTTPPTKQNMPSSNLQYSSPEMESGVSDEASLIRRQQVARANPQLSRAYNQGAKVTVANVVASNTPKRNDPCPCGSGLKYKKCGMINAPQHK